MFRLSNFHCKKSHEKLQGGNPLPVKIGRLNPKCKNAASALKGNLARFREKTITVSQSR